MDSGVPVPMSISICVVSLRRDCKPLATGLPPAIFTNLATDWWIGCWRLFCGINHRYMCAKGRIRVCWGTLFSPLSRGRGHLFYLDIFFSPVETTKNDAGCGLRSYLSGGVCEDLPTHSSFYHSPSSRLSLAGWWCGAERWCKFTTDFLSSFDSSSCSARAVKMCSVRFVPDSTSNWVYCIFDFSTFIIKQTERSFVKFLHAKKSFCVLNLIEHFFKS